MYNWSLIKISKYAWVVPLKDKKRVSIVNASQNVLDSSKRKEIK